MNFIDLFAGAGGLSEGFIRAGFTPIAHVESDKAACNTILTRVCFHHLNNTGKYDDYIKYIRQKGLSRRQLYEMLPVRKRESVINAVIGPDNKNIS